jgi:exodeoxyribonuclease-3
VFPKLAILNVYIPQGNRDGRNLNYKLDSLCQLADFVKQWADPPLILCGDFNIARTEVDLARPSANTGHIMFTYQERAQLDQLLLNGYVDALRELYPDARGVYSWWPYAYSARSRNVGWRLDYFFVSSGLRGAIMDVKYRSDIMGSDHCPIELTVDASDR